MGAGGFVNPRALAPTPKALPFLPRHGALCALSAALVVGRPEAVQLRPGHAVHPSSPLTAYKFIDRPQLTRIVGPPAAPLQLVVATYVLLVLVEAESIVVRAAAHAGRTGRQSRRQGSLARKQGMAGPPPGMRAAAPHKPAPLCRPAQLGACSLWWPHLGGV